MTELPATEDVFIEPSTEDCSISSPSGQEALTRRPLALALLLCSVLRTPAKAQDAARVQPRSYRVALENDRVRVLEFTARPGIGVCGVGIHSHPDHVTVMLTPAKVRITQNGRTSIKENKAGDVFWEPAVTHEVENYGGAEVRSLIIEVKPPGERSK